MMTSKIVLFTLLAAVFVGCQSGIDTTDLTEDEQKKLLLVAQENVASFGAPPMIPPEHEFVIGEDIYGFENGGEPCLDCHGDESEEDIPQTSHPDRRNCLQCHLPQMDETAKGKDFLVGNTFDKFDPKEKP